MTSSADRPQPPVRQSGGSANEALDLGAVQVVDIVADVVHELDKTGQRIQMVMERAPTIVADSGKLAEVTSSLLRDALEASSEDGPIEVEVAARCLAPNHDVGGTSASEREECGASVSVAIRDRSPGSAKRQRIDNMLLSAHQILQLHKGRLWFAAETGQGRVAGFCLNSERAA
ncbi:MAG: hypothetical protein IH865_04335 [Chloroflexi bacterium]|nr:hypothetical protein [Chloroflexota bacterium]